MRASLDTNAIIHFYRADLRCIIFDFFDEVFIYEQIRTVELKNHGEDILEFVDADIEAGKIKLYTDQELKENSVLICPFFSLKMKSLCHLHLLMFLFCDI